MSRILFWAPPTNRWQTRLGKIRVIYSLHPVIRQAKSILSENSKTILHLSWLPANEHQVVLSLTCDRVSSHSIMLPFAVLLSNLQLLASDATTDRIQQKCLNFLRAAWVLALSPISELARECRSLELSTSIAKRPSTESEIWRCLKVRSRYAMRKPWSTTEASA